MESRYDYMFEEPQPLRYNKKSLWITGLILAMIGLIVYFLVHKM